MKKYFSKVLSVLLIAGTMTVALPARQANAGIILLPAGGIGIFFIILGALYNDAFLILLDADGNLNQSTLENNLSKNYSFIDDRDVISNLAVAIREKAVKTAADKEGKKTVSLSRDEILKILEPTGLAELNPAAVEQLINDLK